jgi:large subunit ribosomal protein L18
MNKVLQKKESRVRRQGRIRARITGTTERPRLAIFKSNRYIYAQLINDETGTTLASADSRTMKAKSMQERAKEVGLAIAEAAKAKGVEKAVFDRGGFRYQGAVAALADGARGAGLQF